MNCRIDAWSYWPWATTPRFAYGETISVGTRVPSPKGSTTGGRTWSNQPPPSSYVITTATRDQYRLAMIAVTISPIQRSPAPTVEETEWAFSRAGGFTNATPGGQAL